MKSPPPRSEGSNPSLSATTQKPNSRDQRDQKALVSTTTREGLGTFALPLTRAEFVRNLADGMPVEVPRGSIFKMLGHLEEECSMAEVHVSMDAKIAQVRPVNVQLKKGAAR